MRVNHTHIVGVESDQDSVKIKFRLFGSDMASEPLSVEVTPSAAYLSLNLNFAEFENGGNAMAIPVKSTQS